MGALNELFEAAAGRRAFIQPSLQHGACRLHWNATMAAEPWLIGQGSTWSAAARDLLRQLDERDRQLAPRAEEGS
jgi:hypothetical protein